MGNQASPFFKYPNDLNVGLSIGWVSSAFLNVSVVCLWESHLSMWLRSYSSDAITTTSIHTPTKVALPSSECILLWRSGSDQIPAPNVHIKSHLSISFTLCWHTCLQKNITPANTLHSTWHLINNKWRTTHIPLPLVQSGSEMGKLWS